LLKLKQSQRLPAFLAQASLQYFDFESKVVYFFLQTGHFFSKQITPHNIGIWLSDKVKTFSKNACVLESFK
jgi:hypothetical protein